MEQKIIFREMLSEIKALADKKGNYLTKEEIDVFFANACLNEEQMEMIYQYLREQRIEIEGDPEETPDQIAHRREKKTLDDILAGFGFGNEKEEDVEELSEKAEGPGSLELYLRELKKLKKEKAAQELELFDRCADKETAARDRLVELYLPLVCELVSEYDGTECLPEDLIQDGNMGLLLTLGSLEKQESLSAYQALVLNGINQAIQNALREQQDTREMGDNIAKRVNHLNDAIKNLEEDLETGVSVEELSAYLEMPEEEIRTIIQMAGDEMKIDGYEK